MKILSSRPVDMSALSEAELDAELEKGYADDCIIMVGSEMSANRVMRNLTKFIEEKLGMKVNMTKSKVDRPQGLKYLGFGFCFDGRAHAYKAKPHVKSVVKFKVRMLYAILG